MANLALVPARRWEAVVLLAAIGLVGPGCDAGTTKPPTAPLLRQVLGGMASSYEADCNDPDAHDFSCTDPSKAIRDDAHASGYPYYIGHAEPTALFFSRAGASGYNMKWKFSLPATEPSPNQSGSQIANFELYIAMWLGLALCDPNSFPYGACTPLSDANNPATAGAAFLELQFYPPGLNCSNTQWCARLHINTLQNKTMEQKNNCLEPTTQQFITTDGTPGGPFLLMNNGDTIDVTIRDTASGLEAVVRDATTSTTGSMIASGANGFVHNANQTNCDTEAFDFHALYQTAAPGQTVPWATLSPNVGFDFEIGHFELCGNASCSMLPDGDSDDTSCSTVRGVGGCFATDTDQDGVPYNANWPDGTAGHPASFIIGAPNDGGVGPMSSLTSALGTFNLGYSKIKFNTTEGTGTTFYPFFSQAGTGAACRFNFGNDIPGVTTNNFGRAAQYGTTIDNPCFPGQRPTVLTYNGETAQGFHDVATLAATLADTDGKGIAGATIDFTVGSQGCSATTNSSGHASCGVTLTQAPGAYTVSASFPGDAVNLASSAMAAFTIRREESVITYSGATTSDFNDPVTVAAVLAEDGILPLAGRTLSFSLNGTDSCMAVTDGSGRAACSITPSEPAGTYPLVVSFVGDTFYLPSSTMVPFVVTLEEVTLTSTGALQVIAQGQPASFSATLLEDGVAPVVGRTISITLGTGAGSQTCSGVTNALGVATCTITPTTVGLGPQPLTDTFVSDGFYQSATNAQQALLFAFLPRGAFVLGDTTAAGALGSGATVTWWGASWDKANQLSGGSASPAFKGFALDTSTSPPACGGTWSTTPGNSPPPPLATVVPSYMGVVVTGAVNKAGSAITGGIARIVVVKTDPGYAPDPGHPGTGTVVATFCP
ncbi:MAG TPA: Ig-like domain repeat protein [Polyangia bacterium]|nr:Ig-like domain repeat protein [Polyangia bacterium]